MPAALPTGTVTLLFTDIEGSTRLLDELGPRRYGELLAAHHRVCREAWEAHGGSEVDTAGDAFFVAFAAAPDAVRAAQHAQERLSGLGLRVRMGMHTGEVWLGETGYIGLEVHRSARIAASAHGGQILVSAAAAATLSPGTDTVELRDLGEHRFKDLSEPQRVYQIGMEAFPPIRSLYQSNLPVPGSEFLGRQSELGEVVELLLRDGGRLVTLTGPGGTGKTRLALQAAAEVSDAFPNGVWWLALSPLDDPASVLTSIAQTLGVRDQPERDLADVLAERLAGKRMLLLLDNAEHLLPDLAPVIAGFRSAAPTMTLLVTSRERLQLSGEEVWRVPALTDADGVELFVLRSRALGAGVSDSPAVRELCARLDSLPLALELAAARTVVFSPGQLLERLGQRLDLLKGGRDADPRQQTLRATIDWSYRLLSQDEQRVFRALSVFPSGCTYEAAETVAGAEPDALQSLLDKSLLGRRDTDAGRRYSMLDTIREYAAGRLSQAAEAAAVWARFDAFLANAAEALGESYLSSRMEQCLAMYAEERANVWLAIDRSRSASEALARYVIALYNLWVDDWEFAAARHVVETVLERLDELAPGLQARFLVTAGTLLGDGGDAERGREFARRAIPILEQSGDALWLGRALCCAGAGEMNLAEGAASPKAMRLLRRGAELSRAAGDDVYLAVQLVNLADLSERIGESDSALSLAREAAAIGERLDHDLIRKQALMLQAVIARGRGELDLCETLVREALDSGDPSGRIPDPQTLFGLVDELIRVSSMRGDFATAARLAGASETLMRSAGVAGTLADGLEVHAAELRERGPADVVERATREGRAMSTPELVQYARGERGP